jgi:UDP-GlcNAc:undecaprenyl-phosphate GlcNAc-1-phosphate transferase
VLKSYFIPFLLSFSLSIILTPIVKKISLLKGYVAEPREDRWNKNPTALFGGVAIFVSFIIPYIIFTKFTFQNLGIILAGCFIFGVGLFDDIFHIKPYTKLLGQIIIAALLVNFGIKMNVIPYPIISILLTILWMTAIINSFNLLDNMDGLSGGIGAIVGIILFVFSVLNGNFEVGLPALILAGSLIGFLRYNFNPAQIFMGDSGSMFIGFMLAAITLQGSWKESTHLIMVLFIPMLILAVPIFDTMFVTLMRSINSRKVFQGGKDHISHRMVVLGLSEKEAVVALYFISMIFGAISILSMFVNPIVTVILILLAAISLVYFAAFLGKVKVYEGKEPANLKKKNGNVIVNSIILYKRRALEVTADFILICAAYISANLLRYEGILSIDSQDLIAKSLPLILIIKYVVFFRFGLYRGMWRYVSIMDLVNIFKAVSFASITSMAAILFIWRFQGFSRTVFIIDWLLLFLFIAGSRVLERIYKEIFDQASLSGKKILIYGAGDAGEAMLREIKNNKDLHYDPIGFIDDDEVKIGRRIHGVPILGSRKDVERIVKTKEINEVIIAMPKASKFVVEDIIGFCNSLDVKHKKVSDILPKEF